MKHSHQKLNLLSFVIVLVSTFAFFEPSFALDAFSRCLQHVVPTDQWTEGLYVYETSPCPSKKVFLLSSRSGIFSLDLSKYCSPQKLKKSEPTSGLFYFDIGNQRYEINLVRLAKVKDISLTSVALSDAKFVSSSQKWTAKPDVLSPKIRNKLIAAINTRLKNTLKVNHAIELLSEAREFDLEDQQSDEELLEASVSDSRIPAASDLELDPDPSNTQNHGQETLYWQKVQNFCSDYLAKDTCRTLKSKKGLDCKASPWRAFATIP